MSTGPGFYHQRVMKLPYDGVYKLNRWMDDTIFMSFSTAFQSYHDDGW